ncbi:crotonase/enoyl-CoA hydratase family protein [Pseudonocardia broussonetiae]|uniref:Crotonase/enoyl-CoA hydratase family protein n=1 Tax=Pseudonocardia broussonetiae TaxID=2736640 RepID=A0A6M6JST3_9PSEU|nr:crotonase/enoyl-CoA hydratase family protein [Pseudonocardia broussonetiae]QJY49672.1 crotonase/enoyl-CoA hydratase family protein [Pseudonocardia broussonetiae]
MTSTADRRTGTEEGLRVEHRDGVAVLTIDRPARRNAIDLPTARAISDALDELDSDPALRVAVLCGTGSVFSAGMDLKAFAETGERPVVEGRGGFGIVARPPSKPVIAAVEGAALGGGFEIVLACDLVVAAAGATFGLPEVRRGLTASGGGLIRLPRRLPRNLAMEAALTGAALTAARCAELGLVNRVVPDGTARAAALELAAEIARNAPLAVRVSKEVVHRSAQWSEDEAFARQEPLVDPVRRSADAREGARAFAEKRAPRWEGR